MMVMGVVRFSIFIPTSHSLKEKRMVLRSLRNRLRNNFNISVIELEEHGK